jgi:RNA polymerase sigma factor (sigma-70 family)
VEQLAAGDPEGWNEAFRCLFPVAFEAAKSRLSGTLQDECEDVAMETLSDILDSGANVASDDELKPLTAAIARNKASDRLRRHLAEKRGGNNVQSLELIIEANAGEPAGFEQADFLDRLNVQELRELLTDLSAEVKKEYRIVLRDHFFDQLSYQEIADKRQISLGSVGVYLQRGLGSLRSALARKPKLKGEFLAMLSDATTVKVLLPMIWAVQAGGRFFADGIWFSLGPAVDTRQLSDEQRLQVASEESARPPELRAKERSVSAGISDEQRLEAVCEGWMKAPEPSSSLKKSLAD